MGLIDDPKLQRLVYRSISLMDPDDQAGVTSMVLKAEATNSRAGLSGCLALADGRFVQVLEGGSDRLHALMGRILTDGRHRSIDILGTRDITARLFKSWGMTRIAVPISSPELVRIVTQTGGAAHVTGILLGLLEGGEGRVSIQNV